MWPGGLCAARASPAEFGAFFREDVLDFVLTGQDVIQFRGKLRAISAGHFGQLRVARAAKPEAPRPRDKVGRCEAKTDSRRTCPRRAAGLAGRLSRAAGR